MHHIAKSLPDLLANVFSDSNNSDISYIYCGNRFTGKVK